MSNEFIHQCLNVLKRDDVQSEINHISKPIINYIFSLLNPYLYLFFLLIILIFTLLLAIIILLIIIMRNNSIGFNK
jgi:hypothetical protein